MADAKLTAEQEEFLKICNEEFESRYSNNDEAFMKRKNAELKPPPIMDPWFNKSRKLPPHSNNPSHRGYNQGHSNYDRNDDRSQRRPYDRVYDRHHRRQERYPYYKRH